MQAGPLYRSPEGLGGYDAHCRLWHQHPRDPSAIVDKVSLQTGSLTVECKPVGYAQYFRQPFRVLEEPIALQKRCRGKKKA